MRVYDRRRRPKKNRVSPLKPQYLPDSHTQVARGKTNAKTGPAQASSTPLSRTRPSPHTRRRTSLRGCTPSAAASGAARTSARPAAGHTAARAGTQVEATGRARARRPSTVERTRLHLHGEQAARCPRGRRRAAARGGTRTSRRRRTRKRRLRSGRAWPGAPCGGGRRRAA